MCGAPRTSQARFCPGCGFGFGFGDGSSAALTAPPAAPVSAPPGPAPVLPTPEPVRYVAAAPVAGARSPRRPIPPVALALAVVVVLVAGALGTGIVKLGGAATTAGTSAAPSGPVQSPPPIDNLATPAQGTLTLGDSSAVETINLAANGASPTVSAPGQPWDGLTIDVPAGAWTGSTLNVTSQPITNSSFGGLVTPVSPLYTVSGADGMAPAPVTLKIPAVVPADSFAMGFFYDASSGGLEGMPLLAEDGTSVTIATQHFSGFFLSMVKLALLSPKIDSGFRPGKDDWQFENDGSYITPGGNCAGQTLTEAWYYIERHLKAGADRLYGLYDNNGSDKTPDLWQDDSNGYRLASVAQSQLNSAWYVTKADEFFPNLRDLRLDALQYEAVHYAIAVTGEPQLMFLWDSQGGNTHAMLAYRVAPSGIFVADPNFPAAWRLIPFNPSSGKFGTYLSGTSASAIAEGKGVTYTRFVYAAKTALVDWSTLGADWAAFDAGTIGNGTFPSYSLEAVAGQDDQGNDIWVPLVNGYQTANDTLAIRISDPSKAANVLMEVYRGTSSTPEEVPAHRQVTIDLSAGENPLGILVVGIRPQMTTSDYVDFVRLTVIRGPAASASAATASAATASAANASAATGGHWVLTSTTSRLGGPGTLSYSYGTLDSSSGQIVVHGNPDLGARVLDGTASWNPPPASIAPGDVWNPTLSVQATCSADAQPSWPAMAVSVDGETPVVASATCGQGSGSVMQSEQFGPPLNANDNVLEIQVSGGDISSPDGSDAWTYSYQWQP
jgi:hypothetical protein